MAAIPQGKSLHGFWGLGMDGMDGMSQNNAKFIGIGEATSLGA
jgi:hypothetical protein